MKRLVGLPSKNKQSPLPKPDINDVVQSTDKRADALESKITDCDNQLRGIYQQIRKSASEACKNSLKQRAKSILLRKKRLEKQAEESREKSFNLDTLASSLNSAEDVKTLTGCFKEQTKQLKKELKKLNLDKIEDLHDELEDLIELNEDVTNAVSKNYDVPPDIDDDELNNQLELLGDEIVRDNDPSYIDAIINQPISATTNPPTSDPQTVDEFGLPLLNTNTNNTPVDPAASDTLNQRQ